MSRLGLVVAILLLSGCAAHSPPTTSTSPSPVADPDVPRLTPIEAPACDASNATMRNLEVVPYPLRGVELGQALAFAFHETILRQGPLDNGPFAGASATAWEIQTGNTTIQVGPSGQVVMRMEAAWFGDARAGTNRAVLALHAIYGESAPWWHEGLAANQETIFWQDLDGLLLQPGNRTSLDDAILENSLTSFHSPGPSEDLHLGDVLQVLHEPVIDRSQASRLLRADLECGRHPRMTPDASVQFIDLRGSLAYQFTVGSGCGRALEAIDAFTGAWLADSSKPDFGSACQI